MKLVVMEMLLFLLILCSVASIALSQRDTLKQGDVLNSSESTFLVSGYQTFTLGFYTQLLEGTNWTYLAIWLTERNHEVDRPVWIGNRDTPLPEKSSAKLLIDASGTLILRGDNPYYHRLSSKQTSLDVFAILLDSGNFVLREVNTGKEVWSSFDNPTDTLLPGMKLGVDHRTGRKWSLTSWRNNESPGSGAYSLEWDPTDTRLVIKNRGVVHWTSGELMNSSHFRHFFLNDGFFIAKFLNISTNTAEYFSFTFTLNGSDVSRRMEYVYLIALRLDASGYVYDSNNGPTVIDVGECYGYANKTQQSEGCELWDQPNCRVGGGQRFEERSGKFMNHSLDAREDFTLRNSSGSLTDCRENCWKDCDCVGYRSYIDGTCGYWRGTHLQFEQDVSGYTTTLYVLDRRIKRKSKKWIWILIPTVIATIFTVFTVLLGLLQLRRRRRTREEGRKEQELKDLLTLEEYSDIVELSSGENGSLKVFSYAWVVATTNNFSSHYKLGQGGFGSVYKGVTPEGQEVAVKQLSERSKQGLVEFKNEVVLIAKLQHTNLVKLLGFCIHGDQKMLIYEFMPNKSLDFYLFDPKRKEHLTWERRFNIIEGIAQGLLYLHKYSRVRIIHRDMKVSNILLDENMNPKISDFGMAKILRQNATEANTTRIGGTYYMAPEYAIERIFSTKSDVYSFGVLTLEIVSGKKNNHFRNEDSPQNLVEHAWELWKRDAVIQLVDPAISILFANEEQLHRCINIGLLCVEHFAVDRPSMSDVISMLTNENLELPKPKKAAFVSRFGGTRRFQEGKSEKFTVNELSISAMEGR